MSADATDNHVAQLGRHIGTLEALAESAPESKAGTVNAAADILRAYGESLDVEVSLDDPDDVTVENCRSVIVFVTGRVRHWVSEEQRRVLQRAVELLDNRIESESEE